MGSTWVGHHEPVSKRQSIVWKLIDSQVQKKLQLQQSINRVMLTASWDRKGQITIDLFEKDETVNRSSYC